MRDIVLLFLGLLLQDAVDQIPDDMERLVRRLAARLPGEQADTMAEVWLAELHAIPGKLPKLAFLVPLLLNSRDLFRAAHEQAAHGQSQHLEDERSLDGIQLEVTELIAALDERGRRLTETDTRIAALRTAVTRRTLRLHVHPQPEAVADSDLAGLEEELANLQAQNQIDQAAMTAISARLDEAGKKVKHFPTRSR